MTEFHQSSSGKRTLAALLVATLLIWATALWLFGNTLNLGPSGIAQIPQALQERRLAELVPAILTLTLALTMPLLVWGLLVEWRARYGVDEQHLRFRSLGATIEIPWEYVQGLSDDPDLPQLLLTVDPLTQINNRLVRLLYRSAMRTRALPLYQGIAYRELLLDQIVSHSAASDRDPTI